MTSTYEQHANAFDALIADVSTNPDPTFSEADTRVKIIDRILTRCLGWPETGPHVRREEHVHAGFIDYVLQSGGNFAVLEAKKVDVSFSIPSTIKFPTDLSVKNLLKTQNSIKLVYDQVTRYAHERGIPFCIISNGTQWLIFPGVRTDNIHIRHSRVLVFNGLENIRDNFLDFWGILSFESVASGSLSKQLADVGPPIEESFLFNAEGRTSIPYDRNHLSLVLVDLLPTYFGDLYGDPTHTEMLRECFVLNNPAAPVVREITGEPLDEAPTKTLSVDVPIRHFYSLPQVGEKLEALINSFLNGQRDKHFQVLLGRVGIGKSTFLAHFFDVERRGAPENHFTLRLDCQSVDDTTNLDTFFLDSLWEMLLAHPRFAALTSQATLLRVFADEVNLYTRGPLAYLKQHDPKEYEAEISKFLGRQLQDRALFVRKVAAFLKRENFARFVFVFDNVDQLEFPIQEKVIRFAYSRMNEFQAFVILSMWEETFYASKRSGKVLSTIRTAPLQITRQSITSVLVKRLQYLVKQIKNGREPLTLLDETECDRDTFCDFLTLILKSLLVDNKRVRTFLELVGLGNIRRALEMFSAFLTAGSLETRKIIGFMKQDDDYLVPVHEFIKSVMLGSLRYYSEATSDILNLFAVGDLERPSHFTRLRILQWLYERRHEATVFGGTGLLSIDVLTDYFERVGVSRKDTHVSLRRLIEGALVENDLRSQKLSDEARAVRLTPTGRYFLITLYRQFAYMDLAMQDTPFFDADAFFKIERDCEETDMEVRFRRCENFLDYLQDQEDEELVTVEKLGSDVTWRKRFVPGMRWTFENTRDYIRKKELRAGGAENSKASEG